MGLINYLAHSFNVFRNRSPNNFHGGYLSTTPPDRHNLTLGNERTIIASIYNRIGIDVSQYTLKHIKIDDDELYVETMKSSLNECLVRSANLDQTGRELILDAAISLMDEGYIAIVPTVTSVPPVPSGAYDIESLRVAKILEWAPAEILVDIYNEWSGKHENVSVKKRETAIISNPLYYVMNEPNSTLQRLVRTLMDSDKVDSQISSEKFNLIFQVPYQVRTDKTRKRVENRREDLEKQIGESKHGIAYIDGSERVIQLNRPIENNLTKQVEYLTSTLYSQLGLTQGVFDGSADEKEIKNYQNRTVKPILLAITEEMERKFLTKTAITQGQRIAFFLNPFGMASASEFADISDSLTRNAILSTNEVRSEIGYKRSDQPGADELRNKNLNADKNSENALQNGIKDLEKKEDKS